MLEGPLIRRSGHRDRSKIIAEGKETIFATAKFRESQDCGIGSGEAHVDAENFLWAPGGELCNR